jgi:hypothetical protein
MISPAMYFIAIYGGWLALPLLVVLIRLVVKLWPTAFPKRSV